MTTDPNTPTESNSSASSQSPPHPKATPYGYYAFIPYAPPEEDVKAPAPAPVAATTAAPAGPTDPAAIAAVAAAIAALAAIVPRPAGYVHVVTGIPPGLAALLRSSGPWTANILYSVPPTGPLGPIQEIVAAPEWYCVTRGRFVGVFDQYAQAHWAIRGVSNAVHKSYSSQAFALAAFNQVVQWGGIEVA